MCCLLNKRDHQIMPLVYSQKTAIATYSHAKRFVIACLTATFSLVTLATLLTANPAAAQTTVRITQPNGSVVARVEDLRIQVVGGSVVIQRTWANPNVTTGGGRWYFNPIWADLTFRVDSVNGSIRSISRLDTEYARVGNGIYVFDRQDFINAITVQDPAFPNDPTKTLISGWRYYNSRGDWTTYNVGGIITAYGDRNNTFARFVLDASNRIDRINDAQGGLILGFTYTGDAVSRITDRDGRQVNYVWANGTLTQVTDVLGNVTRYEYQAATIGDLGKCAVGPYVVDLAAITVGNAAYRIACVGKAQD
jgi:hypothetical protein